MRPRPLAVVLGVLTGLAPCAVLAAQGPLVKLAIHNGVHYVFIPMLVIALILLCLAEAAQAIIAAVQLRTQRTHWDAARLYRVD